MSRFFILDGPISPIYSIYSSILELATLAVDYLSSILGEF